MRTDRNALKSGVFIIVTVCLIIAIIIGIQGAANFGVAKQVRTVSFALADDIGGLQAGDEVRVGGHEVDRVLEDGDAALADVVAFIGRIGVAPKLVPGKRIERPHVVGHRKVQHTIDH